MSHHHQPPAPGSRGLQKVAIPRLGKRDDPPSKSTASRQNRVSRACLGCRTRKIKCNGAHPVCSNCSESAQPCVYVSSRKDRLKTATTQNQDMAGLLQRLRDRVGAEDKQQIEEMLSNFMDDIADAAAAVQKSPDKQKPDEEDERGEANVSAEVGSNEDLDAMDEDLMRNEETRATGFLGKNSEIQWLRKLHHDADNSRDNKESSFTGPYGPPGKTEEADAMRLDAMQRRKERNPVPRVSTSSLSFFLDDEPFDLDLEVDPYELPPFETAEPLFRLYMESVHDSFPVLAKKSITGHFYHYYAAVGRDMPYKLPRKLQAMLNLVFAIGSVYLHLIEAEWQTDDRVHLIYHSRAWQLSLKDPWWFSHPDLPQLQITGLLAIYYLSIGHINRSWVLSGMALRFGYSLGLHLRNEDRSATPSKKELYSRIWWGLYTVEQMLLAITGRPGVGGEMYCSVPLPLPLDTEDIEDAIILSRFGNRNNTSLSGNTSGPSSRRISTTSLGLTHQPANSGTFIASMVKIGQITQNVLSRLYTPTLASKSWESLQQLIAELLEEVECWASALPQGFQFLYCNREDQRYQRERNILEIQYLTTKILISRPCLCRLDRRIHNQTQSSNDFNQRIAATCVDSARAISRLLPDEPDSDKVKDIYEKKPWWSMVHIIMQGLTVLMLEISYEWIHFPRDRSDVIPSLKKLVRWLRIMRANSAMARRAYSIAFDILKKQAARINIDISELVEEDAAADTMGDIARSHPVWKTQNSGDPEQSAAGSQVYAHGYSYMEFYQQGAEPMDPTRPAFGNAADPILNFPDLFTSPVSGQFTLPNLFVTTFDQENPLPLAMDDFMTGNFPDFLNERPPHSD